MKCPFEIPVESELITQHGGINLYRIKGLIWPYTQDEADYIVQAINCHEKFKKIAEYIIEHGAETELFDRATAVIEEAEKQ